MIPVFNISRISTNLSTTNEVQSNDALVKRVALLDLPSQVQGANTNNTKGDDDRVLIRLLSGTVEHELLVQLFLHGSNKVRKIIYNSISSITTGHYWYHDPFKKDFLVSEFNDSSFDTINIRDIFDEDGDNLTVIGNPKAYKVYKGFGKHHFLVEYEFLQSVFFNHDGELVTKDEIDQTDSDFLWEEVEYVNPYPVPEIGIPINGDSLIDQTQVYWKGLLLEAEQVTLSTNGVDYVEYELSDFQIFPECTGLKKYWFQSVLRNGIWSPYNKDDDYQLYDDYDALKALENDPRTKEWFSNANLLNGNLNQCLLLQRWFNGEILAFNREHFPKIEYLLKKDAIKYEII